MKSPTEEATAGEAGEIWLKADSMMVGYDDDRQATEQAFVDGWYRTGDVAPGRRGRIHVPSSTASRT